MNCALYNAHFVKWALCKAQKYTDSSRFFDHKLLPESQRKIRNQETEKLKAVNLGLRRILKGSQKISQSSQRDSAGFIEIQNS